MGTGKSGKYYTTHGSSVIHHEALIHSLEGEYINHQRTGSPYRLKSGGHGQDAIDYMRKQNIEFNIVYTYENGVRVGNVPKHRDRRKQRGTNQSWFPSNWSQDDVVRASEYVTKLKRNTNRPDGYKMWGKYKKVWVYVVKTNGKIATVFPDSNQSDNYKR